MHIVVAPDSFKGTASAPEAAASIATGRLTQASYFLAGTTAFIDVAAATGLPTVQDCLDPLHADSYGTGVLIADAETRGATSIVLGLGGTASIDAGMGILTALGAAAHDARGYALPKGGAPLVQLDHIDTALPAAFPSDCLGSRAHSGALMSTSEYSLAALMWPERSGFQKRLPPPTLSSLARVDSMSSPKLARPSEPSPNSLEKQAHH